METSERPVPGLLPAPINMEQYYALTPEKLELWQGYLVGPPDWHEERRNLLLLLLVNEGLQTAVRLAPAELWRQALDRVEPAGWVRDRLRRDPKRFVMAAPARAHQTVSIRGCAWRAGSRVSSGAS